MSIESQLASSLSRRDEVPNQELAAKIAGQSDTGAVKELIDLLKHKNKDIQHDAIKVLYETGTLNPSLLSPYPDTFLALLKSKNNRLQWGAMTALQTITLQKPELIFESLPEIILAANSGSVITKDYAVNILIDLCSLEKYHSDAFELLKEQLLTSPVNQLPMYSERALPFITKATKERFIQTLTSRISGIDKESKQKRVIKVIKKAQSI
jgi:hypothetical protein